MELENYSVDLFSHTRIVIGMVIGLAITRTLLTFSNIIQTPATHSRSLLHILWLSATLVELALFWYSHIEMVRIRHWNFGLFAFFVLYAIVLYMQTALLTSDKAPEYGGYEEFFTERRHWFFSFFALGHIFDLADSFFLASLTGLNPYDLSPLFIFLCLSALGWISNSKRVQFIIVCCQLVTLTLVSLLYAFNTI
jgi:hypothetical protein